MVNKTNVLQVLIVDPKKPETRGLLKLVESFITHTAPLRIGLVFSVNSSLSTTGFDDVGVGLLCSFNYIMQKKGATSALNFLISVRTLFIISILFSRSMQI